MPKYKTIRLISLPILLVVMLLSGCDDGKGLIMAVMAVAAASGVLNSVNDGGNDDQNNDSKTDENTDDEKTDDDEKDETSSDTDTTTTEEPEYETFVKEYDGAGDDLLTAGLGQDGLMGNAPTADPENPTATEIRKATIFNQYQALIDMRATSGYSSLYGPTISNKSSTSTDDGKVAGKEYLAYANDSSGKKNVTMMVQVPDSFDRSNPCLVAAPSPGSRGVYGAISTAGEWGLKNNCAVAYTDKGTGNGVHDLYSETVNRIDGTRGFATDVEKKPNFKAEGTRGMDLAAYNSNNLYRIAQKHAHSQQNPEDDWDTNVLDAINFAFEVLNLKDELGNKTTITPENTIVIASSISTGGAASLRAVEQDSNDLIDGVVVAAPLINPHDLADGKEDITIQQGNNISFSYENQKKSLFDVITYHNVFQLCASANTRWVSNRRCSALQNAGLLDSLETELLPTEAQRKLNDYGTLASTNIIADNYVASSIYAGYANLYANAYGKFSVVDNLCNYSYAGVSNGLPSAKSQADLADDFQTSSGIPPTDDTYLINNNGNNGQGIDFTQSADGYYLDGAICLRKLAIGKNIGIGSLTIDESDNYKRVQEGLEKTFATGNLRGKPAIIVHGRDDALAHVNFSSRAYYALNKTAQSNSELVYIEVKNANHFDGLNEQYDIDTQVPLSYYLSQALDRMYDHLKNEVSLPVSQVIPTNPLSNNDDARYLPDILNTDDVSCTITLSNRVLNIPEC